MVTSQDLVPTGQPHGDRQRNVAAMQLAGVPTSSGGGPPPSLVGGAGAPPQPQLPGLGSAPTPGPSDLSGFDVLAGREPPPRVPGGQTPPQGSMFRAQLATTQNRVMIDTFKHVSRFLEG